MVWLEAELYKISDNFMNSDDRGLKLGEDGCISRALSLKILSFYLKYLLSYWHFSVYIFSCKIKKGAITFEPKIVQG